jgi:hypothetical protein
MPSNSPKIKHISPVEKAARNMASLTVKATTLLSIATPYNFINPKPSRKATVKIKSNTSI